MQQEPFTKSGLGDEKNTAGKTKTRDFSRKQHKFPARSPIASCSTEILCYNATLVYNLVTGSS
jgi:hypothetical protein